MSDERRKIVLKAIVQDYVSTREPVGSKAVVEHHNLGVSPATIRNDMAQLEEAGLIVQPHTSAGRIPTDAGYREFVDSIAEIKPLSAAERNAIERMLGGAVDLDDVLDRAVRLLAQITNQVAVVQYPSLRRTAMRHVELVVLGERHILVVIITDAGRVEQRTVLASQPVTAEQLSEVRVAINTECTGKQLSELPPAFERVSDALPEELKPLAQKVSLAVAETLEADSEERVVVAGTANLTRYDVDFHGTILPVLDALEEQVLLLRMLANQEDGLRVQIGRENETEALTEASVVSSDYAGVDQRSVARLGILGPTRMDYPTSMSSVYAVAKYLSDILGTN